MSASTREHDPPAIGIDLGGTNVRAGLYSGIASARESGADALVTIAEQSAKLGEVRDPNSVVRRLGDIIRSLREQAGDNSIPVGVGFAGMLEGHRGFVVKSPHLHWTGVPFGQLLRDELRDDNVLIFNDVNAITFAEFVLGSGATADDVLAVFVGTGVGGGLVAGGKLIEGATGCAAEIGHCKVVLDDSARACACGSRGCVEAYIGGHYLQRRARGELRGGARSLAVSIAGGIERVNPSHLDVAAGRGDDYSLDLFAEVAPLLGVALANAVTLLNPSHLILGGGVLSKTPVLCDHVIASLEVAVNAPAAAKLTIATATLGGRAGTVGAALLANDRAC